MAKRTRKAASAAPAITHKTPRAVELNASSLTADIASGKSAWATLAKLPRETPLAVLVASSDAADDKDALAIARTLGDHLPLATFSCEDEETGRRMLHARRVADQALADQMFARDRRARPEVL